MPDLSRAVWRKSTHSGNGGECVEVADNLAADEDLVFVRDSKNQSGPVLTFTRTEWRAFVGLLSGRFEITDSASEVCSLRSHPYS